jgi:hypothetical protein
MECSVIQILRKIAEIVNSSIGEGLRLRAGRPGSGDLK